MARGSLGPGPGPGPQRAKMLRRIDEGVDIEHGTFDHLQLEVGHRYFINVGSVGQPRDGDCRASFATFDTEEKIVRLHRVEYDIQTAQQKILDAGLPEKLALRLQVGR